MTEGKRQEDSERGWETFVIQTEREKKRESEAERRIKSKTKKSK